MRPSPHPLRPAARCVNQERTPQERKTMTNMHERQQAFESKFARDEDFKFKVTARRNKLFGFWVAEQLNLPPDAAEKYAKELVMVDMTAPGDDDLLDKVEDDMKKHHKPIPRTTLIAKLEAYFNDAREQMMDVM
ncbi:MAG: DUF1476 domain-containing protein [Alphaproteobacteria bacterium]|nr:DUF1476 domain-containing protein [Alphaproteobacteria bacterium]